MPVFRIFGGCGKLAILTDRLNSFSGGASPPLGISEACEIERRVGILGLDTAWLGLGTGRGLLILEGVRMASFEGV